MLHFSDIIRVCWNVEVLMETVIHHLEISLNSVDIIIGYRLTTSYNMYNQLTKDIVKLKDDVSNHQKVKQ